MAISDASTQLSERRWGTAREICCGNIVLLNHMAEEVFGYQREELLGQPIESLIPERFREQRRKQRNRFLTQPRLQGMGGSRCVCARRKNGTEFPVEVRLSPVEIEGTRVVFMAVRDVSERERLERLRREKVILVAVEMPARKLTYANAGHPSGIVLDASGRVKTYLESTSPPRVVLADAEFPVCGPLQLCQGDCVVMVTDGALEARSANSEPYGLERVIEIVRHVFDRPAKHIVKTLTDDAQSFSVRGELEDDVTTVVLKMVREKRCPSRKPQVSKGTPPGIAKSSLKLEERARPFESV